MRQDLRRKGAFILVAVLICVVLLGPTGQSIFKTDPIRQGLDLKGGIELLLVPDYRLGINFLTQLEQDLATNYSRTNVTKPQMDYLGVLDNNRYEGLKLTFANAADVTRAKNLGLIPERFRVDAFGETKNLIFTPKYIGNVVELQVNQAATDFPEDSLQSSLEIIRHRISDASSGMAEADVRLDKNNRINVQLPGINSLEQANEIITATGRLTFRIDGRTVLDGTRMKVEGVSYQTGGWVISFSFSGDSAKAFAKITTDNVHKQMGVYLDETELMSPVINSPITEGRGQIQMGNSTKEEVEKDALLMKSGALPISLKVQQSTQVAPTLGKEIVRLSIIAGIIGVILVMAFMVLFYGVPGLLADAALILFGLFSFGVLAIFRGVLTLPGIAGWILTMGVAVDANIIIFERIKDELRNGKRVRAAVQSGFNRAFITILDCNATVLIAAGVLFFFGSGAVQGFAVTLAIGVVVQMITAVFVTRFFLDWRIDHDPDRYAKYFGGEEVIQG